jgi:hypothetical protein
VSAGLTIAPAVRPPLRVAALRAEPARPGHRRGERAGAGRGDRLGDLTGDGFRGEYELAREYLDKIGCERMIVIREPRLAQRRLRALRGAVRRAPLRAAHERLSRSSPSTRPSPTSTTADRRGRYEWIEERFGAHEAVPADLRPAPPPAARAGHGPRAQHRHDAGRHAGVSAASRCTSGALRHKTFHTHGGSRTCSGQRRHGLDDTAQGEDEALFTTDQGHPERVTCSANTPSTSRTRSFASTAHVRVLRSTRDCSARLARLDNPARMHAVPVIALIDGEHHPPRPRRARRARPRGRRVLRR